jgi:hypothetical protein
MIHLRILKHKWRRVKNVQNKDHDFQMKYLNPLTNSRIYLSFKLKCEFLDHITPDFGISEQLPHSLFDDCSTELGKILEIMNQK